MEDRKNKNEFEDIEKLLYEIPNTSTGYSNSMVLGIRKSSTNSSLATIHEGNESSDDGSRFVTNTKQSPVKANQLENSDHSLTDAFRDLALAERETIKKTNCNASPNNGSSLDSRLPRSLESSYCNMDSRTMYVPSFQSPNPLQHGLEEFGMPRNGQHFSNMYSFENQEPIGYCDHSQVNQPRMSCRNFEDEYYRMLYLQQLQNQPFELQYPNQNIRQQQHFVMPRYRQIEQSHQQQFWNKYAVQRGLLNQSMPSVSSSAYNAVHVYGKSGYSDKNLIRSQGVNLDSLKAAKFGSFGGHELLNNGYQNELSNGHVRHNAFSLDGLNSWDSLEIRSTEMRTLMPKYNSVDEVSGQIYQLAKDQNGCRFLQKKFAEGNREDVEKIFQEIVDHVVELMTDPFGNYLVQKLLEVCYENQRMQILHSITKKSGDLISISCDMHGTRAVQKVIETLRTPEQFSIVVSSLKPGIVALMKNINGNHVAQRCLQYLMPEHSEFIFEAATANCVELATDRHGCCVLQKCLTHSEGERKSKLLSKITSNALLLSQDPFGNYVVQFVFDLQLARATEDILDQLEGKYGYLSVQKYSSNVVEKCLKYAGEERCARIIWELKNNVRLDQVMQDPYGNYVIQAALHHSKGALHAALVESIRPLVPVLQTNPYGKKVLSSNGLKK